MSSDTTTTFIQVASISTALIASGSIATFSLFDIPLLKAQPASRALPSIRWLFSRGSHIFPQAAFLATSGFSYLAYKSLTPTQHLPQILSILRENNVVSGYLLAAALSFSIGPFTRLVMVPTNFKLIQKNEDKGGEKSSKSREENGRKRGGAGGRSAEESVECKDDGVSELTDLSGPQTKTDGETSAGEDKEVARLLEKFSRLNYVRALLLGSGGLVGLIVALSR